jgi:hypothetical protein
METEPYVPDSLIVARRCVRKGFWSSDELLSHNDFVRAWCSLFYLFPGLHPDGYDDAADGWPRRLRRFADEAWARAEAGDISEDQLYPADAQWCGILDRIRNPTVEEAERRTMIAARFGDTGNA